MKTTRTGVFAATIAVVMAGAVVAATVNEAISDPQRAEANSERDGAMKPGQVLPFIALAEGDVVLDWGAGGGYWTELFSGVVGDSG